MPETLPADDQLTIPKNFVENIIIASVALAILVGATLISFRLAKRRTPAIILPGGVTYLGPSPSAAPVNLPTSAQQPAGSQLFTIQIPQDATWTEWKGHTYPFKFSYPSTLSLGFYPNDAFDAVVVFYGTTKPEENLILRVEDLTKIQGMEQYAGKRKQYAENWWKQYSYWKAMGSVTEFKTRSGLTAYRAKYKDPSGTSPYDHIFIEVPNQSSFVVWISGKLLPPAVFDKMVDSFSWGD